MAYTTIDDPSAHFQIKSYTGTGSSLAVTFDGNSNLQPDLVWVKSRTNAYSHYIYDSNRGVQKKILADTEGAESTLAQGLTAFGSDGMTFGTDAGANESSDSHVVYGWKANGGTTSTNTAGTNIDTTVQTNSTAGFSIITYTGTGTAGDSDGHVLGADVHFAAIKARERGTSGQWAIYHKNMHSTPEDYYLRFDAANLPTDSAATWNDTDPTSSVITFGTGARVNSSSDNTYVGYIWTGIQGYSKFGGYTGNGNADGVFVYTGFKPAFVMQKRTDSSTDAHWHMFDIKRNRNNVRNIRLEANNEFADSTGEGADFLSNGFKWRSNDVRYNGSDNTYVYIAFAEHPFVSSKGVPCTADGYI